MAAEPTSTIQSHSPHLAGALARRFDGSAVKAIEPLFSWAIAHGGFEELDFVRQPEVSYNPRPARLALIVINEGGSRKLEQIAGAVIAGASYGGTFEPDESAFQRVAAEIAYLAAAPIREISRVPNALLHDVATVGCAVWLDRARHLHLGPVVDGDLWRWASCENTAYLALARERAPLFVPVLETFGRRAEERSRRPG